MGPEPQLTVRAVNAPEEPYYLDFLFPGNYESQIPHAASYPGLDWNYTPEEIAALDQDLLDTYRLLLVTESGETFLSDTHSRRTLQSTVTLNWAARTIAISPLWSDFAVQFFMTLLCTLLLVLFGFSWTQNWKPFLLVNLLTQGGLTLYAACIVLRHGVGSWTMFTLVPAEVVILLAESLLYRFFLTGQSKFRAVAYGIFANLCSAVLGILVIDHVWNGILSIL